MIDATQNPARPPLAASPGAGVAGNLAAGARLALGRRVHAPELAVSLGHTLFALALAAALIALEARLEAGAGAEFWVWGFVTAATRLEIWLAAAALLAWTLARADTFHTLTIALTYALLPVWLATTAFGHLLDALAIVPGGDAARVILGSTVAWQFAVFWRVLGLLPGLDTVRLLGANALFAGALFAVTVGLPDSSLYYRPVESADALDVEAVYYRQQALMDRELATLAKENPGTIDLYFVGLGAYAAEDVFMREVRQVRSLFESEFGLEGRSVSLINNPNTVWETPLANRHNLERVLARLGRLMNVEQDVVFLFLTSHGYENASVAVDFEPLGLNDLNAADVRKALDDAGIRWRVIVISACYSGSFIDALESPHTVLITASAHDRASFGCSHESRWTYFGRAYFAEALRQTRDFVDAFALARVRVEERERREGKPASDPQIRVGRLIRDHLHGWRAPGR